MGTRLARLIFFVILACSQVWAENEKMNDTQSDKAIFAGGCFWCMESAFDSVTGVTGTTVGYTGGHKKDPNYQEVSVGGTGHLEALQIEFDPKTITYAQLLKLFWRNVDPTRNDGQFCDNGPEYRSLIFYLNDEQKQLAEDSKAEIEKTKSFKAPIVTEILPASVFYPAEDYHQSYHRKNPIRYKFYRYSCGRDARLDELWGKDR